MASFDPYQILGIAETASQGAIKTAYRKLVQTTHPDRGGDPEQFIAIVKAFGLLSDPDARRLYDATGVVDDEGLRNYRRDVATILADMFDAAVATAVTTGLRLERVNFVKQMTVAVETAIGDTRTMLGRTDQEISALQGLRQRIRRQGDGANIFVERLDAQIGDKAAHHASVKRRLVLLEAAIVELGNYESEVDLISALQATP